MPQYAAPVPPEQRQQWTSVEEATQEVGIDYITPLVLAFVGLAGVWPCAIVSLFLSAKNKRKMGAAFSTHSKWHLVRRAQIVASIALLLYAIMAIVGIMIVIVDYRMVMNYCNQNGSCRNFASNAAMQMRIGWSRT